nr:unnamed protein product [Callosobruchus analis]
MRHRNSLKRAIIEDFHNYSTMKYTIPMICDMNLIDGELKKLMKDRKDIFLNFAKVTDTTDDLESVVEQYKKLQAMESTMKYTIPMICEMNLIDGELKKLMKDRKDIFLNFTKVTDTTDELESVLEQYKKLQTMEMESTMKYTIPMICDMNLIDGELKKLMKDRKDIFLNFTKVTDTTDELESVLEQYKKLQTMEMERYNKLRFIVPFHFH